MDVECAGDIIWDYYKDKPGFRLLAGALLNTASYTAAWGLESALIGAVNERDLEEVNNELRARGVVSHVQSSSKPTATVEISLDGQGVPSFRFNEDNATDNIIFSYGPVSDYLCFGTFAQRGLVSRSFLTGMLLAARSTIVYDINLRPQIPDAEGIIHRSLPCASVVKVNEQEWDVLCQMYGRNVKALFKSLPRLEHLFITRGGDEATLYTNDGRVYSQPVPPVKVLDTTGCGDAFTAMIIAGLHDHIRYDKLLENAVFVSSQMASFQGAFNKDEVKRVISEAKQRVLFS